MIDFHKLHVFSSVVNAGSFSAAASSLRLTQSAVSAHIKDLESTIGLRLIDRSRRPISPTEVGHFLYRTSMELMNRMQEIEKTVADIKKGNQGQVILSTPTMLGSVLLPPLIVRFHMNHPGINVRVRIMPFLSVLESVLDASSHFGLVISDKPPQLVDVKVAGLIDLVLVQAPDKRQAMKKREVLDILKQKEFILPSKNMRFVHVIEEILKKQGLHRLPVCLEVGNWEAAKLTVLGGMGVTILPREWVCHDIASKRLEELRIGKSRLLANIYLIRKPKRYLSQPIGRPEAYSGHLGRRVRQP